MSWRGAFAETIREATAGLPADLPLSERVKAVDAARPKQGFMSASWPQKAWQAARRDYLVPFGYVPKTKKQKERDAAVCTPLPLLDTMEQSGLENSEGSP